MNQATIRLGTASLIAIILVSIIIYNTTRRFHDACVLFALNAECWTETPDVHGIERTATTATTVANCRAICVKYHRCVAVDWEWKKLHENCWILTTSNTQPTSNKGFVTHYKLNRTCLLSDREYHFCCLLQ